jgi:hypothetical protein
MAMKQLAKVTPFAGGDEAAVRKSAAGDFFQCARPASHGANATEAAIELPVFA